MTNPSRDLRVLTAVYAFFALLEGAAPLLLVAAVGGCGPLQSPDCDNAALSVLIAVVYLVVPAGVIIYAGVAAVRRDHPRLLHLTALTVLVLVPATLVARALIAEALE